VTPSRSTPAPKRRAGAFRTVVVPLDGSPFAEHALPVAAAVAGVGGARLRLVLVHQLPPPPRDRSSAKLYVSFELAVRRSQREYLRRVAARLNERRDIRVTTQVLKGTVGPALEEWIAEIGAELVVMTTHGRGAIGRALLGGVADHLIRTVRVPTILVRPTTAAPPADTDWKPDEVVVPLDGSPTAESALAPAADMARTFGAAMTLVQVVQPLAVATDPPLPFPTGYDERITEVRRREAQDYLEDIARRLREEGLAAGAAAVLGVSPAGCLLELGRSDRQRLLAIATHGRGGASRLLLGSVADKLIRGTEVPVLVVPPKRGRG
jgi:nucleotide-binding universal stress UspA family protein